MGKYGYISPLTRMMVEDYLGWGEYRRGAFQRLAEREEKEARELQENTEATS